VVGQTIGSYRILSEIGTGGMGVVYLAEHRHLRRKAAVKVLLSEFANRPDLLERFFSEARATSSIDHPGIVQVLDCEVDAQGRPYIVMEYLVGQTLAAHMAGRALPSAEAVPLTRRMAQALAAAHDKGIVHRDIKPENVFVLAHPPGTVKMVDFGIAKLAREFKAGQQSRTQTGVLMGTPLYMSPEQCRGAGAVDHRTDIYSVGCVLFEMLTGRPPFQYEGLGELVAAHLTEAPPEVRALVPAVPEAVNALVASLLRKPPGERPQTMAEVVAALTALDPSAGSTVPPPAAGSSTAAPPAPASVAPPSPARTTNRPNDTTFGASAGEAGTSDADEALAPSRGRGGMIAVAALVLIAGGAGGAFWWKQRSASSELAGPAPVAAAVVPTPPPVRPPPAEAPRETPPPPPAARPAPPPRTRRSPAAVSPAPARPPATTPPPASAAPARVVIDSEPPGAEVCLAHDHRLLGRTSASVELPADAKKAVLFVRLPGYRVEKIKLKPGREDHRKVVLHPLGDDELEAPSPCGE
jgi:serine/threonine-protein kinase